MKVSVGSRRLGRGPPSRGIGGPGETSLPSPKTGAATGGGANDTLRELRGLDVFHKFKIGQEVEYSPPRRNYAPRGKYVVTRLLPERDGEFEYFIKSLQEAHERIARESELRGISATSAGTSVRH